MAEKRSGGASHIGLVVAAAILALIAVVAFASGFNPFAPS